MKITKWQWTFCVTKLKILDRIWGKLLIGITLDFMKYLKTWDKSYKKKLEAPKVPPLLSFP
jgi:hypothetical protein